MKTFKEYLEIAQTGTRDAKCFKTKEEASAALDQMGDKEDRVIMIRNREGLTDEEIKDQEKRGGFYTITTKDHAPYLQEDSEYSIVN